jgi:hypothetical protein
VTSYSSLLTTTQENDSSDDEDDDEEKNHELRAVMTTFERDRAIHRFKEEKRILPEELNESIAYSELEYEDQYEQVDDVKNYFRALKLAKSVEAWVEAVKKARPWGMKKEQELSQRTKEWEKGVLGVEGHPEQLKKKERYLAEWSSQLTSKHKAAKTPSLVPQEIIKLETKVCMFFLHILLPIITDQ